LRKYITEGALCRQWRVFLMRAKRQIWLKKSEKGFKFFWKKKKSLQKTSHGFWNRYHSCSFLFTRISRQWYPISPHPLRLIPYQHTYNQVIEIWHFVQFLDFSRFASTFDSNQFRSHLIGNTIILPNLWQIACIMRSIDFLIFFFPLRQTSHFVLEIWSMLVGRDFTPIILRNI